MREKETCSGIGPPDIFPRRVMELKVIIVIRPRIRRLGWKGELESWFYALARKRSVAVLLELGEIVIAWFDFSEKQIDRISTCLRKKIQGVICQMRVLFVCLQYIICFSFLHSFFGFLHCLTKYFLQDNRPKYLWILNWNIRVGSKTLLSFLKLS